MRTLLGLINPIVYNLPIRVKRFVRYTERQGQSVVQQKSYQVEQTADGHDRHHSACCGQLVKLGCTLVLPIIQYWRRWCRPFVICAALGSLPQHFLQVKCILYGIKQSIHIKWCKGLDFIYIISKKNLFGWRKMSNQPSCMSFFIYRNLVGYMSIQAIYSRTEDDQHSKSLLNSLLSAGCSVLKPQPSTSV